MPAEPPPGAGARGRSPERSDHLSKLPPQRRSAPRARSNYVSPRRVRSRWPRVPHPPAIPLCVRALARLTGEGHLDIPVGPRAAAMPASWSLPGGGRAFPAEAAITIPVGDQAPPFPDARTKAQDHSIRTMSDAVRRRTLTVCPRPARLWTHDPSACGSGGTPAITCCGPTEPGVPPPGAIATSCTCTSLKRSGGKSEQRGRLSARRPPTTPPTSRASKAPADEQAQVLVNRRLRRM